MVNAIHTDEDVREYRELLMNRVKRYADFRREMTQKLADASGNDDKERPLRLQLDYMQGVIDASRWAIQDLAIVFEYATENSSR